jgi:EPS-associated MarR family transcriptional regulator
MEPAPESKQEMTLEHLELMRLLSQRPVSSQREVSAHMGMSLGKAHYLIHALLERGLVKAQNFKRSNNKVAYTYLLTPEGMKEKLLLTRRFLRYKEIEFEQLQRDIEVLKNDLESRPE